MTGFRTSITSLLLPSLVLLVLLYVRPTHAFGAGNIPETARIEGQNWRHGDIEDTLLALLMSARSGKKFSKMDVKRVYFGNWLRDYSQAVDVGTVKYVSAKAITLLLWILGFMSFGYGAREFQVTMDRLGCYRPEEHIDNPKDYADNLDARQYDRRLRGPVDERRELSIDEETGLKNYIANDRVGITTSSGLVRNLFSRCIQLGREYNQSGNKDAQFESLRLLGTGCHCLEDYSAHSNYTELALIELGERGVFPHVGRHTAIQLRGARQQSVYPIVTGTFGGVDFLHSVTGELSDKVTQSEVQELEGTINQAQVNKNNVSVLRDLLSQLPSGIFGDEDHAGKADELEANATAAQMQNMHVSPKEPEEWTRMLDDTFKQVYPILEFHDDIMRSISEALEKIPILPELLENLSNQVNIFVFSLLAPFVVPVIKQVKNELATGSSEIIQSSIEKQHIVFRDDSCSDPTHSMLSKDHFSNILNEPAGQIASNVLKWVVPQIVQCWDDESVDPRRTIERIIHGVFHHPALREYGDDGASDGRRIMFQTVERWWRNMDPGEQADMRRKLSRDGVEQGQNHKPDVHDGGHGCGKPLGMPGFGTAQSSGAPGGQLASQLMSGLQSVASGNGDTTGGAMQHAGAIASDAVGGGVLGSMVGGLVGGIGGSLLGGAFDKPSDEHHTYEQQGYTQDGGYKTSFTETAHRPSDEHGEQHYGQAFYAQTTYPSGGQRDEYSRYEQDQSSTGRTAGYGYQHTSTSGPTPGGGYEQRDEQKWERPGGEYTTQTDVEGYRKSGEYYHEEKKKHHKSKHESGSEDDSDDGDDYEKKARKKADKERKKREKEERKRREERGDSDDERRQSHGGRDNYGGQRQGDYEPRGESSYDRQDVGREDRTYGGTTYDSRGSYGGGSNSYGQSNDEQRSTDYGQSSYGRRDNGGDSYGGGYNSGEQTAYGTKSSAYGGDESYGGHQQYSSQQEQSDIGYGRQEQSYSQEGSGYAESGYGQEQRYGGSGGYDDSGNRW